MIKRKNTAAGNSFKVILILFFIFGMAVISFVSLFLINDKDDAYAIFEVMEVMQENAVDVIYKGESYINTDGKFSELDGENSLYKSLTFKLDGNKINVGKSEITITNYNNITLPNLYQLKADINYGGYTYSDVEFEAVINKAMLNINLLLESEDTNESAAEIEINEGVNYTAEISYSGFVGSDDENILSFKPIVPILPKRPTKRYEVRAEGASSDRYEITYGSAYVTILSNPVKLLELKNEDDLLLSLTGEFSPYAELEFLDIGVKNTSIEYAEISEKIQKNFLGNDILKDYEQIASYRINLIIDGEKEENITAKVRIKMSDAMEKHSNFLVMQLTNDGVYSVVQATNNDGYLEFNASDLGDFAVFTLIEGLNTTVIAIGLICGIVLLALIIIFVALFRKKY